MCSTVSTAADPVAALRAAVELVTAMDVAALPATESLDLARELSAAVARLTGTRLAALTPGGGAGGGAGGAGAGAVRGGGPADRDPAGGADRGGAVRCVGAGRVDVDAVGAGP